MSGVIVTPVAVDAQDFLNIRTDLTQHKLHDVVNTMSATIAKNARFANSTAEELSAVRGHIDVQFTKLNRMMTQCNDAIKLLQETTAKLTEDHVNLKVGAVTRKEFSDEKKSLWAAIKPCEALVQDYETGGGERIQRLIRNFVEGFFPKWFEPVSAQMWTRIEKQLSSMRIEVLRDVSGELEGSEDKVVSKLRTELEEVETGMKAKIEERSVRLELDIRELEKVTEANKSAAVIGDENLQNGVDSTRDELLHSVEELSGKHQMLLGLLGLGTTITQPATTDQEQQEQKGEEGDSSTKIRDEDGAAAVPATDASSTSCSHPLHDTPAFRTLLNRLQRDISTKASETDTQLRDHIKDTRQEIDVLMQDKASISTLRSLMHENRDKELYGEVANCAKEIKSLQQNKVDNDRFSEALFAKADKAEVDSKVDTRKIDVMHTHNDERFGELQRLLYSTEQKHRELSSELRRVKETVDDGGGVGGGGSGVFHSGRTQQNNNTSTPVSSGGAHQPDLNAPQPQIVQGAADTDNTVTFKRLSVIDSPQKQQKNPRVATASHLGGGQQQQHKQSLPQRQQQQPSSPRMPSRSVVSAPTITTSSNQQQQQKEEEKQQPVPVKRPGLSDLLFKTSTDEFEKVVKVSPECGDP